MATRALLIAPDGEILSGPAGWTCELDGFTYTVTHGEAEALLPQAAPIAQPSDIGPDYIPDRAAVSTLIDVGENSFSWRNFDDPFGSVTNALRTIVHVTEPEST